MQRTLDLGPVHFYTSGLIDRKRASPAKATLAKAISERSVRFARLSRPERVPKVRSSRRVSPCEFSLTTKLRGRSCQSFRRWASRFGARTAIALSVVIANGILFAQTAPLVPEHPWDLPSAKQAFKAPPRPAPALNLDPAKIYALSELVNIAEQNNPETRVAWQYAKARATDLGIAKSTLYPTLAAVALAGTWRQAIFLGPVFARQTVESFSPALVLDYVIFDFGERSQQIAISRNNLLAANFQFNNTHRTVIFQVMEAYYRLLNSNG